MTSLNISGFTIASNIVKYYYPVLESIQSLLPLVKEMIIVIGKNEDGTLELIKKISSPKIKIFFFDWDDENSYKGNVLSKATNFALKQTSGDWCFYLQADEIIQEQEYQSIKNSIKKADQKNCSAISFKYYHFKGDYYSINPWAYAREIRIIKNNNTIQSVGDACTFHLINKPKHPKCLKSKNHIYHYGWVKHPQMMIDKIHYSESIYKDKKWIDEKDPNLKKKIFEDVKICRIFKGNHPKIMQKRIKNFPKITRKNPRWYYLEFYKKFFKYGWV
jgi:glycosyltransferase involved in cell wall biosynthesis